MLVVVQMEAWVMAQRWWGGGGLHKCESQRWNDRRALRFKGWLKNGWMRVMMSVLSSDSVGKRKWKRKRQMSDYRSYFLNLCINFVVKLCLCQCLLSAALLPQRVTPHDWCGSFMPDPLPKRTCVSGWDAKCFKKNPKKTPNQFVFQARVLATIGVTRGLGDHDLKVHDSNIFIKPFLSCCPEVKWPADTLRRNAKWKQSIAFTFIFLLHSS